MSCLAVLSKTKEKAGTTSPLQPVATTINNGSKKRALTEEPPEECPSSGNDKRLKLSEVEIETIKTLQGILEKSDKGDRSLSSNIASKVA